ncbi:MAG: diadenylate cyclase CdaA [bacterium]
MIFRINEIIDILIIAFIFYQFFILIKGTKAVQMFIGILLLLLTSFITKKFHFHTVNWLLSNLWSMWVLVIIIIFQSELREVLVHMGQRQKLFDLWNTKEKIEYLNEIIKAVENFSYNKSGALITIEREIGLKNYIEAGTKINAEVSVELLTTLFYPGTSLHDGSIIIKNGKIVSAGCFFPLTQNPKINKNLGSRHRAALGITEETDAISIIVSEETGEISIATKGKLTKSLNKETLEKILLKLLVSSVKKKKSNYPKKIL